MRRRVRAGAAPFGFGLLTLTVSATTPAAGLRLLKRARAEFARRKEFRRAIAGGEGQVHIEPAHGAEVGDAWTIHLHAAVELGFPLHCLDLGTLATMWAEVLDHVGVRGSLDLRQDDNLKAEFFRRGKA